MTGGSEKKDEGCIGSGVKKLFSSGCGCGTWIVPKTEVSEPKEE